MLELYAWPAQELQAIEDESGATAVEYALLAAGIALAIIVGVQLIGGNLGDLFNEIASEI